MGKKRFFNFKNLFFVSFLAVAGIFSAAAIAKDRQVNDAPVVEKADAATKDVIYGVFVKATESGDTYASLSYNSSTDYWTGTVTLNANTTFYIIGYVQGGYKQAGYCADTQFGKGGLSKVSCIDHTTSRKGAIKVTNKASFAFSVKDDDLAGYGDSEWIWETNSSITGTQVYTVSFNMNGHGSQVSSQDVVSGGKASQPTAPTATGYTFGGWYKEPACTNAWNFSTDTVTSDKTLYAKWTLLTLQYSLDGTNYTTLASDDTNSYAIPNFIKNYYVGPVDQVSGTQLYLKLNGSVVANNRISCISATDHYDNGRLNNLQMVSGVPKFRYSNVSGYLDIEAYNDNGTEKFKVYAHGLLEYTENYSIILNNNTFEYAAPAGENEYGAQWKASDIFLTTSDHIKFINRTAEFSDSGAYNPYNPSYVNGASVDLLTIDANGATVKTGKEGYYDIYVQHNSDRVNVQVIYGVKGGKVTFNLNGHGSAIDPVYARYNGGDGEKITAPTAPTAAGYTFGGWYKEEACTNAWNFSSDVVTSDTTLHAKWTPRTDTQYTVNHYWENVGDDNYTLHESIIETGTTGATVTAPRQSYGNAFNTPEAQQVTIAADGSSSVDYYYRRTRDAILWTANGGRITSAEYTYGYSVKSGTPIVVPTAVRDGYTFIRWYDDFWKCEPPASMPGATNYSFFAQWAPNSYTISYKDQGGGAYSGNNLGFLPTTHTYATATDLVDGTKDGYIFGGWYDNSACTGDPISSIGATAITDDITLYAKWNTSTVTVTIQVNDASKGSISTSSITDVPIGSTVSISNNTMTINGTTVTATPKACPTEGYIYSFSEWTNAPATITGAVTITATFIQVSGQADAAAYARAFNTAIAAKCSESGATDVEKLAEAWGAQATNYDALAGYVKYWVLNDSSDADIVAMHAKYDYVYGKYREDVGDDFLNRNAAKLNAVHNFSPFDLFTDGESGGNTSTIIIIIASSVSLLSITALSVLLVKKRKAKQD